MDLQELAAKINNLHKIFEDLKYSAEVKKTSEGLFVVITVYLTQLMKKYTPSGLDTAVTRIGCTLQDVKLYWQYEDWVADILIQII